MATISATLPPALLNTLPNSTLHDPQASPEYTENTFSPKGLKIGFSLSNLSLSLYKEKFMLGNEENTEKCKRENKTPITPSKETWVYFYIQLANIRILLTRPHSGQICVRNMCMKLVGPQCLISKCIRKISWRKIKYQGKGKKNRFGYILFHDSFLSTYVFIK